MPSSSSSFRTVDALFSISFTVFVLLDTFSKRSKLNCEVLHEDRAFEIRWSVVESGETIVFQLVGRIDDGNYMAFGISGEDDRSVMLGGDAMIGWFDQSTGRGNVVDYYLGSKSVCKGDYGTCPDVKLKDGSNNVRLLSAAAVNGFTILTFQRKLKALDHFDKQIITNGSQPVIWAVGTMQNDLAGYHNIRSREDFSIDFGRTPKWNCPEPEPEPEFTKNSPSSATILSTTSNLRPNSHHSDGSIGFSPKGDPLSAASDHGASYLNQLAWKIPPIPCHEPEDRIFYAQVGPSGRKEFFKGVTAEHEKPENVWYINGLLMPEIYLVRHKNYTFVVQGGDNSLYITDDPKGDYEHKTFAERQGVNVYAGIGMDSRGNSIPTAVGKSCRWLESEGQPAETFASYAAYQRSLSLDCKKGHSGVLQFTPDERTPNLVYYQSYSKGHLGWKIHILDECERKEKVSNEPRITSDKASSPTVAISQSHLHQPDQNVGESIQREAVVAFAIPHESQNLNLRDIPKPIGSGHNVENTYLIDGSVGGEKVTFSNPMSLDGTRLIFNGKHVEQVTQGPSLNTRQGQIVAAPLGGAYPFPQNGALYQIAIDSGGKDGNRGSQNVQNVQNVYAPAGYQVPMAGDGHLLRRNGVPQLQVASPFKIGKYGDRPETVYESKPEYYIGNSRQPLMSHQIRYDGSPAQSLIYATTSSPQRLNGPMSFMPHYEKPDYSEMSMRMPGPGQILRVQNIPRRHPSDLPVIGGNPDNGNVKYIEYPHSAIQILQNDGRGAPLKTWTHSRNLPKRDHSRQEQFLYLNRDFMRGAFRSIRRDSRDDNSHQFIQMTGSEEPRLSPLLQSHVDKSEIKLKSLPVSAANEQSPDGAVSQKSEELQLNHGSSDSSPVLRSKNPLNLTSQAEEHKSPGSVQHQPKDCKSNEANSRACGTRLPSQEDEVIENKRTNHSAQQSQVSSTHSIPNPVFESFGPVFRPSPLDTDGFNNSDDYAAQSRRQYSKIPEPTSKLELPRMLSKPSLTSPLIPFLRRNPLNRPRKEYWLPDLPTNERFPSQKLQTKGPGSSSSSTFHKIIKFLVPGSENHALKYDIKTPLPNGNYPLSFIPRFPFRQQPLIQARNEVVGAPARVPPRQSLSLSRLMERSQRQNGSVINNNKAQINNAEPIGRNDESAVAGTSSSSGGGGGNGGKEVQDNLSLTLLTDVWQIINQQGISKPSQPPSLAQEQRQHQPIRKPARQFPAKHLMMITSQGHPGVNPNFPHTHQRQPFYSRGLEGNTEEDKGKNGDGSGIQTSGPKSQKRESLARK